VGPGLTGGKMRPESKTVISCGWRPSAGVPFMIKIDGAG
jgi:hypothetical protein